MPRQRGDAPGLDVQEVEPVDAAGESTGDPDPPLDVLHPDQDRRPDLRPSGGGKGLHLDRLIFLQKVQCLPECKCLRYLYDRARAGDQEEETVKAWADEFNLQDDWVVEVARRTSRIYADPKRHRSKREQQLRIYEMNEELIERGEVSMHPPAFDRDDLDPPFDALTFIGGLRQELSDLSFDSVREFPLIRTPGARPDLPRYDPTYDNESDWKQKALEKLEAYTENQREQARRYGAEASRPKRARSGDDPYLHFEWLARWQVKEETQREIAQSPGDQAEPVNPKTVGVAVRAVADRIQLTRRTEL